jgi:glycosyltransferase involved in cell wall biosynthesis
MPAEPSITAVIITRGRPELLDACLKGAVEAGKTEEIIVGVNGPDEESLRLARGFAPAVTAVQLPQMCRGEARNVLAARARGRLLCFLDDDTVPPPGYFTRLAALAAGHPGAVVFGGGQTLSGQAGAFESAVAALLASSFGGGPFTERFSPVRGTRAAGPEKFILCNLTLDGEFLRDHGLAFEGHLTSAEENLLLGRMAAAGARMVLSGDLNLVHRRRADLAGFARQVFSCGRGRGQITSLSRSGFCAFTLLPPAALAAFCACALFFPSAAGPLVAAYAAAGVLAASFSSAPFRLKPAVAALSPVLHVSYACGWLAGAVEGLLDGWFSGRRPPRCCCEGNP